MLDPWTFGMIDRDWAALRPVDEQGEPLAEADRVEVMRSWQRLFGGNMLLADGVPVPVSNSDVARTRERFSRRSTSPIGPEQLEYSGRLVVADPPHADKSLRNAADMAGAVVLVRRGTAEPACGCGSNGLQTNVKGCNRCSFIGKAARLRDAGAVGMILSMDEEETREPVPRDGCRHKGTPDTPVAYVEGIYHVAADEFKPWCWWSSDGIDADVQAFFTPSDAPTCDWFGMKTKQTLYYDRQNSKLPATVMVAKADAERLAAADRIQLSLGPEKQKKVSLRSNRSSPKKHLTTPCSCTISACGTSSGANQRAVRYDILGPGTVRRQLGTGQRRKPLADLLS
jgi:hypothetical protein